MGRAGGPRGSKGAAYFTGRVAFAVQIDTRNCSMKISAMPAHGGTNDTIGNQIRRLRLTN